LSKITQKLLFFIPEWQKSQIFAIVSCLKVSVMLLLINYQ